MRIWIKELLVGIIVANTLKKSLKLRNWKGFLNPQKLKINMAMKKKSPELQMYQYYCCLAEVYIIHSIQLVFPIVTYSCDSWTIKEG